MAAMLSVAEALARVVAGVVPTAAERVGLHQAGGRVLAEDLVSLRTQPPFAASAMDGYALIGAEAVAGARLRVVGESAAGHGFDGTVEPGTAVRIFTGAPVPAGADTVLIQEDARRDGEWVEVASPVSTGRNIRARGVDFAEGEVLLKAGTRLDFRTLSLAAAMNHATLPVHRKPRVAILATGDELRAPGSMLGPDQIVASNAYGVAEIVRVCGGEPIDHGIAPDIEAEIAARTVAAARDADVLVTLGGASVGDHDYVQQALGSEGMELGFWKIAMRPGKPLIFGRLGATRVLGLPGNPVSSLVCALLYLKPLLQALTGDAAPPASEVTARLGAAMKPNDQRQDYVRARLDRAPDGGWIATPHTSQDSSLLGILAGSGGLIVRPPGAPAAEAGEACRVVLMQG